MLINRRNIIQNVVTLFSGSAAAQGITALVLLLTARQLGPGSYGQYALCFALPGFTSVLFALGLDHWLLKEGGRRGESLAELTGSTLAIKGAGGVIWLGLMAILGLFLNPEQYPLGLLMLCSVSVFLDSLFATALTAFKASLRNRFTSTLEAGTDMAWLLATLALIGAGSLDPVNYVLVRVLVLALGLAVCGLLVWRTIGLKAHPGIIQEALRETRPFAVTDFLSLASLRQDVLIIGFLLGKTAAGVYSPAVGLVNAAFLVPLAVYYVMTPILSKLYVTHRSQANQTSRRMVALLGIIGAGMAAAFALGAPLLVLLLGESYTGSLPVLRILSLVLLFKSASFAMAAIIIATDQQRYRPRIQLLAVLANAGLNLLLVSSLGIQGAAWVYVMTEALTLAGYTWLVWRTVGPGSSPEGQSRSSKNKLENPNLLLINVHSNHNAGDAALAWMAEHQLRTHFPNSPVTLAMEDPGSYTGEGQAIPSLFTWLKPADDEGEPRWQKSHLAWLLPATLLPLLAARLSGPMGLRLAPPRLRPILKAYAEADLVVSAPGGFLYSSGRGLTLMASLYSMALAVLAGKPLYLYPQSFGPFLHAWERRMVGWLLHRTRVVMVREEVSYAQLQACGGERLRLRRVPDIAFAFPARSESSAERWLAELGITLPGDRPLLGVTVINWGAQNRRFNEQERYESAISDTLRFFVTHYGGKALLIPQVTGPTGREDDRPPARRIAARLQDMGGRLMQVDYPLPPDLLKAVYGQMDLFIGTRMHSNIFALSAGVPTLAIGYQHKTLGIAQSAGIAGWVVDIRDMEAQALIERLQALWEARQEVRCQLESTVPALAGAAARAGEILADDYRLYSSERRRRLYSKERIRG